MALRCKDERHWQDSRFHGTGKLWCKHSRNMLPSDSQYRNYLDDFRAANFAQICDLTGENATWNKKCNVEETIKRLTKTLQRSRTYRWEQ